MEHYRRLLNYAPKGPHPAFGYLLPFFEREKAKLFEIIAFSRAPWHGRRCPTGG